VLSLIAFFCIFTPPGLVEEPSYPVETPLFAFRNLQQSKAAAKAAR
jgi:hypothetical protein